MIKPITGRAVHRCRRHRQRRTEHDCIGSLPNEPKSDSMTCTIQQLLQSLHNFVLHLNGIPTKEVTYSDIEVSLSINQCLDTSIFSPLCCMMQCSTTSTLLIIHISTILNKQLNQLHNTQFCRCLQGWLRRNLKKILTQ